MRRRVDPTELGQLIEEIDADGVARVVDRLAAAPTRADAEPTRRRRVGPAIRPGFVERGTAAVADAAYQEGRRLGLEGPRPGERIHLCDVEEFLSEFRRGFRAGRAERAVSAGSTPSSSATRRPVFDRGDAPLLIQSMTAPGSIGTSRARSVGLAGVAFDDLRS